MNHDEAAVVDNTNTNSNSKNKKKKRRSNRKSKHSSGSLFFSYFLILFICRIATYERNSACYLRFASLSM